MGHRRAAILLPLGLAVLTLLWQLGASSLFVDETYSWRAASASLGGVFSHVRADEVAPPGYYLLLHAWIGVFGDGTEWSMRLLSVLAGLALVAAVWWLGMLLGGVRLALLAGVLSAISPLVVLYAQQVRAYVFAMLAVTLAVAAAVQATREPPRATRWLTASAAASIAAVWLHYTALLVLVPLWAYVWTRGLPRRARRVYLAACALAVAVIAPLMVIQMRAGHQGGVAPYGRLTASNAARVASTPFDGRHVQSTAMLLLGVVLVAGAITSLLRRSRRSAESVLVAAAALLAPVSLLAVTIAAELFNQKTYDSLITRYSAVAAPFILIVLAWWMLTVPRPWGVAVAIATLIAALGSLIPSYSDKQPNLRAAFFRIASDYRSGDGLLVTTPHTADYYVAKLHRAGRPITVRRELGAAVSPRLWVLTDPSSASGEAQALRSAGWRTSAQARFDPEVNLMLVTR